MSHNDTVCFNTIFRDDEIRLVSLEKVTLLPFQHFSHYGSGSYSNVFSAIRNTISFIFHNFIAKDTLLAGNQNASIKRPISICWSQIPRGAFLCVTSNTVQFVSFFIFFNTSCSVFSSRELVLSSNRRIGCSA